MKLSSKDRTIWVMSPNEEYYSSEYIRPVSGIIIPALGSYYQDTQMLKRYVDYIKLNYLERLEDFWYLLDKNREFIHLAMGPNEGKAICNQRKMKKIIALPGDLYLCMNCQYEYWLEHNGQKN